MIYWGIFLKHNFLLCFTKTTVIYFNQQE